MIHSAAAAEDGERQRAWEEFDHLYRGPLLVFIRRCGCPGDRAEDLLQSFLSVVAERNWLAEADPERGKMRTFLLTRLKRHLNDARKHDQALKRGGGTESVDFDEVSAVLADPGSERKAESEFDRAWAKAILDRTLRSLEESSEARGTGEVFRLLKGQITGGSEEKLGAVAATLQQSEGAVRMRLQRLREEFRKRLRAEVAETLLPDEDVSEEMRYLAQVLSE
ncbi:RNA polymerase subunit sigma-24 [Haloferula helveola]|uniref:RNA polymerase subunit sigma-24 n=2 Tax=Haloferula helveola TaxID=490095 RepID=A0ABN6H1T3_9BACT|nr:RNA polymerase subunit sigma-24 [Haloferula helveola]